MLHTKCGAEKSIVLGREVEQDLERCSSRIEWRRGARSADAESGGGVEGGGDQGPLARPDVGLLSCIRD
jgi:hypothetical protein